MKRFSALLLCLLITPPTALAQTAGEKAWVTDRLEITLRKGKGTGFQILRMLRSGTAVEVLEVDRESGYSRVRTASGAEGWVLSRYLVKVPPALVRLPQAERRLTELETENRQLKEALAEATAARDEAQKVRKALEGKREKLARELAEIKRISADAVRINEQNKTLKSRLLEATREIQMLRQENDSLRDRSNRDWFLVGAMVVIVSMLFGILLTRIRWRRKSSWGQL